MSLMDLFRGKNDPKKPRVDVELAALLGAIEDNAGSIEAEPTPPPVLRARFADICRDVETTLIPPDAFDRFTAELDAGAWFRLELGLVMLEDSPIHRMLRTQPAEPILREQLLGFVGATKLLTMELIARSPSRAEEFARNFALHFQVGIDGERGAFSRARLHQLDYARLLAEAERAKGSAEARLAHLKKLQDEQDAKLGRRGKI